MSWILRTIHRRFVTDREYECTLGDNDAFSSIRDKLGSKVEINIKKTETGFEFEEGAFDDRLSLEGCKDAPTTEPPAPEDDNMMMITIICAVVAVILIIIIIVIVIVVKKKKGSKTLKTTETAPKTEAPVVGAAPNPADLL